MENVSYWFQLHASVKDAVAVAQVVGDEVTVLFTGSYPTRDQEDATEWLTMAITGMAGCSEYEWLCAEWEASREIFASLIKRPVPDLHTLLHAVFSRLAENPTLSFQEVARTGSPSGRAGDGQPPAPAAVH